MIHSDAFKPVDTHTAKYIIVHVFCPLRLPDGDDHSTSNDYCLARSVAAAANFYSDYVDRANILQWSRISKMLENFKTVIFQSETMRRVETTSQFGSMNVGDILTFPVLAQNAGIVFRKLDDVTVCESFELSPKAKDVMTMHGKIIASYPGPAIEIPNSVFDNEAFHFELSNFLVRMNYDDVYMAMHQKRWSSAFQDSVHPGYITELLTGILRSVGRPADIPRIVKRVGDEVVCNDDSMMPWRRSALWLLIRVALQTTLDRSSLGHHAYKQFMLFFMCHLATDASRADLPSDLLQFMSAKISRRLRKIGSLAPDWLSNIALQTCTSLRSIIDDRWQQVQNVQCLSPPWAPAQLDLAGDIQLSLSNSVGYLRNALASHSTHFPSIPFKPNTNLPRGTLDDFLSSDKDFFRRTCLVEPRVALYDVEQAVEGGIDAWIDGVTNIGEACVRLEALAYNYSSSALELYADNPEQLSVMLLTMMELWIALDKLVVEDIPMLADYSPEVPTSLLEHLLLWNTSSLHRLCKAHEYVARRHSQSRNEWSVFSSEIASDSFVVRFYKKSSYLRSLKKALNKVARHEVREMVAELRHINAQNAEALPQYSHDVGMQDRILQGPISSERLLTQSVIFELGCSRSFSMWRTSTFHLLLELCTPSSQRNAIRAWLDGYRTYEPDQTQWISLGRPLTKVFSWRSKVRIPTHQEWVHVKKGLRLFGFGTWASIRSSQAHIHGVGQACFTYKLQYGPYRNLQKYVDFTSHTSNEVIANQAECHEDLSIHEYMAFGHLRSGGLLQWANILREIRARSFTFRLPEVHMLLAQAISQVGPLTNKEQPWHYDIQQPAFCYVILGELGDLVRDIEANWTEGVTMDTISLLLRRLLASSPNDAVSSEAICLLRTVRSKVFSWVKELSTELTKTPINVECHGVLRDTAAICRGTFDVGRDMIPDLLHSAEDIEVLLLCAMIIHHHIPKDVSSLAEYSRLLLDRDRRLSLVLESHVSHIIQTDVGNQGMVQAVGRIWSGYHPGSRWSPLSDSNAQWFSCATASQNSPQLVHFNVLHGSLFIDGKPLGTWLPNEITWHPPYKLIFGEKLLEVIPSDLPGMDYTTRDLICGHQVYFSLRNNGSDLVIQAKRKQIDTGEWETIQLIPHEELEGDLPTVLIERHSHWLNLSTFVIEIRPLDVLWEPSSENWRIYPASGSYLMRKGDQFLVDVRSETWNMVSALFRPLATPQELIISVSQIDSDRSKTSGRLALSVLLPCYDLSFHVDEVGNLQSDDFRDMVYDENQSTGTLIGLVNQLVLRPKINNVNMLGLVPRCVLIPDGDISCRTDGSHVRVEVTPHRSLLNTATYQTYSIDTDLGCLTGNSTLTSKLYCAYLLAVTSGCSDNPLTGRSGLEEALSVFRSASCWSSVKLSARDVELLGLIASICPLRTWRFEQSVQKVEWRNLPESFQSYELYTLSKAMKERHQRVQQLYERPFDDGFKGFPLQDDGLFRRGARRAAYVACGRSGECSEPSLDLWYSSRDIVEAGSGEHRAYTAAISVYRRAATGTMNVWDTLESSQEDCHVSGANGSLSLRYEMSWLTPHLPSIWLKAYDVLRKGGEERWFQLLFTLPAMAYASPSLSYLVPVFVAFASHARFRFEDPPHYDSYPIAKGTRPAFGALCNHVLSSAYAFEESPEYRNKFLEYGERLQMYDERLQSDANATARELLSAWPCENPPPCSLNAKLYSVGTFNSGAQLNFSDCFRNLTLKEHLDRVQAILNDLLHLHGSTTFDTSPYSFHPSQNTPSLTMSWKFDISDLLARPAPSLEVYDDQLPGHYAIDANHKNGSQSSQANSIQFSRLIGTIEANAVNPFQHQYVSALRTSAEFLDTEGHIALMDRDATILPPADTLVECYTWHRTVYNDALDRLRRHLGPSSRSEEAIERSGQWPRITSCILFQLLASNSPTVLPDDWKKCLVTFILLALKLQRARRLVLLRFENHHEELCRELQNEGCDGWDAEAHPDWLLIQLQGNLLIRRIQADAAKKMIAPGSDGNTAMQLNMGEGKTSVIVPIIAAVLADGDQLVRVIVPKSLAVQTLHLLTERLGGLTNRRVYYLPLSRSLRFDDQKVATLRDIMSECMRERGIMVVQPDHILSLKLVSVENQLGSHTKDDQVAHLLLELQKWLFSRSRDIIDESDEILDVRSQLVFAMGHQQYVDSSPERWTTTEQVLGLVRKHAPSLWKLFPLGVEYESGPPESFPYLRILHKNAGESLISWIVQDVVNGLIPNISFAHLHFHPGLEDAIRAFISLRDVPPDSAQSVKEYFGKTSLWGGLLQLRGLLATGILLYVFKEPRWRVNYGLAPTRSMLAVPYRAKDVPSQRAEFSHPDIAITLTFLSYYYVGLSEDALRLSFSVLFEKLNPSSDYELWVQGCPALPDSLRSITGININSSEQWNNYLFPFFSRNCATINFYLSNVVFPKEGKVCPSKLSSSCWDLAEKKERLVTGFSGTNDGQYLFPLHITQRDPDHQRGTNAKVLSYLLQPENKHHMCMVQTDEKRQSTREFLQIMVAQKPEIRVLLDVGAQMLDLQNYELAKAWLDISPNVSAAIYFNENDELTVCTRDGGTQPLASSSFVRQIDRCIVYLDDAHTRGTDIKFPGGFRAAVTLGPKVTKDRLVQGCMRMRKLGHGHSIMFFGPPEIDRRIRVVAGKDKDPSYVVDTMDILHWAIRETWEGIQGWAPHWVQQGIDHTSRYTAWTSFCGDQLSPEELSRKWLQKEAKTLEDLYAPHPTPDPSALSTISDLRRDCIDFGVLSLCPIVGLDEEQERELIHEVIHEGQVRRRPSKAVPANHSVHQDVVDFVKTGIIPSGATGIRTPGRPFTPAFDALRATSAAADEAYIWSQSVLVTADFAKTVEISGEMDDYLRPVHWIVSAKRESGAVLVILSSHEANFLLPDIRSSTKVHLHLYTPRNTRTMKPCDDLGLYSIPTIPDGWIPPSVLMDQLNVFAGQLYLKDYGSYIRLCRFLGVYARDLEGVEGIVMEPDGFILPRNRNRLQHARIEIAHTFASTPLVSLRALVSLRSKGIDFMSTHMGKILHGRLLSESDFDG